MRKGVMTEVPESVAEVVRNNEKTIEMSKKMVEKYVTGSGKKVADA